MVTFMFYFCLFDMEWPSAAMELLLKLQQLEQQYRRDFSFPFLNFVQSRFKFELSYFNFFNEKLCTMWKKLGYDCAKAKEFRLLYKETASLTFSYT
jgi:hypothetical protein